MIKSTLIGMGYLILIISISIGLIWLDHFVQLYSGSNIIQWMPLLIAFIALSFCIGQIHSNWTKK